MLTVRDLLLKRLTIKPAIPIDVTIVVARDFEKKVREESPEITFVFRQFQCYCFSILIKRSFKFAVVKKGIPELGVRLDTAFAWSRIFLPYIEAPPITDGLSALLVGERAAASGIALRSADWSRVES